MRKIIGTMLAVAVMVGGRYAEGLETSAKGRHGGKAAKKQAMQDKPGAYEKFASDYEKQAAQATAEGKTELANAFTKCAAAKRKIAKAYASENKELLAEANKEYRAARDELKALCPRKDKSCKGEACKDKQRVRKQRGDDEPMQADSEPADEEL